MSAPGTSLALVLLLAGCSSPARTAEAEPGKGVPAGAAVTTTATATALPVRATECRADTDCALSRRSPGACCESLCEPRVVTQREASAERTRCQGREEACPVPACAPPRFTEEAACVAGRCTIRRGGEPGKG